MNTKELIALGADILRRDFFNVVSTLDFDVFCESINPVLDDFKKALSVAVGFDVSFKTDALRCLMYQHWVLGCCSRGNNDWDRDYVRSNYGFTVRGCDFLYYPAVSAKRLMVNFSSMGKDRFDRYSRYWDSSQLWKSDVAYLFFKDDFYKYYIGDDKNPKFSDYAFIIKFFASALGLGMSSVYAVGGSMGGYAALYYSITLGMKGCVVAAPQTTKDAALAHKYRNWDKHIAGTQSQWVDIDKLMHRYEKLPYIYAEYGEYPSDKLAMDAILSVSMRRPGLVMVRKADWSEHTVDTVLSRETVDNVINFFESNGFVY